MTDGQTQAQHELARVESTFRQLHIHHTPLQAAILEEFDRAYYRATVNQSQAARRMQGAVLGVLTYTDLLRRDAAGTPFEVAMNAICDTLHTTIASALAVEVPKEPEGDHG